MKLYKLSFVMHGPGEETEDKFMAEIPALPGCRAWGDSTDQALESLQSVAAACIESYRESGDELPSEVKEEAVEINESAVENSMVWKRIIHTSMAIPGAKVDRRSFLYSRLRNYCDERQVHKAIESRPANAGIASELIDKLADSCIKSHVIKATAIAFAAGLPGGWFMAAAIPADVAQFYWHAIVLSQKLAYLYGWPDILEEGEIDEETELKITLLIGAMMGAHGAHIALAEVAKRLAEQVARRLPMMALTKTAWYPVIKGIGKWIGIQVTKASFARGVAKVIPVVGGAASAGLTVVAMRPMGTQLKDHLRCLELAKPDNELDKYIVVEVNEHGS
ncbi:MAG: type II toxin-antitoxin system HicB family antitoxin [Rhodospirillaceae bacterium]|nr:type II toxin-antitoxin system HicB family antitoxin [Rhodospirillaceae bacterium]